MFRYEGRVGDRFHLPGRISGRRCENDAIKASELESIDFPPTRTDQCACTKWKRDDVIIDSNTAISIMHLVSDDTAFSNLGIWIRKTLNNFDPFVTYRFYGTAQPLHFQR